MPCGSPWLGLFCGGVPFGPLALAPLPAASAQYEAHKLQLHTAPGLKQEESLAGCRWHAPGTRLQYAPTAKKQTQTMMGAPHKKAPPQGPLQAQLLLRFFWSYRLGQNILCMPVYVSLMHETEDVKHESCMCAMTSGLMNACASCPCLMSMPHVHASCTCPMCLGTCICLMCLMQHVPHACCLMRVPHACFSCMCLMHGLIHVPHVHASCMHVPNDCAQ